MTNFLARLTHKELLDIIENSLSDARVNCIAIDKTSAPAFYKAEMFHVSNVGIQRRLGELKLTDYSLSGNMSPNREIICERHFRDLMYEKFRFEYIYSLVVSADGER